MSDTDIGAFCSITDAAPDVARQYIEMGGGDVDVAVGLFFEHGGSAPGAAAPPPADFAMLHDEIPSDDDVQIVGTSIRAGAPESPRRGARRHQADPEPLEDITGQGSATRLDEIFAPPHQLMFHGSFAQAKEYARGKKRWLLVHILDPAEFKSLVLNRDVWRDATVVEFVRDNFVFLQYRCDTPDGQSYKMYYPMRGRWTVDIIDPLTGERIKSLQGTQEPSSFLQLAIDFMEGHELAGSAKSSRVEEADLPVPELEEEQDPEAAVFAAIPASPPEEPVANGSKPTTRVRVKLPSGETLTRTLYRTSLVRELFQAVKATVPEARERRFELFAGSTRTRLLPEVDSSVEAASLCMALVLMEWA